MDWIAWTEKFGFPTACLAAIGVFLGWLIKYIVKDASKRDIAYNEIISNHITHNTDTLRRVADGMTEFRKANEEAHKYQRDEHMRMIEKLSEK